MQWEEHQSQQPSASQASHGALCGIMQEVLSLVPPNKRGHTQPVLTLSQN